MPSPFDLNRDELAEALGDQPRFRVDQVFRALWNEDKTFEEITNVPAALRATLTQRFPWSTRVERTVESDRGATRKMVVAMADGTTVETVLMAYADRVTVCVSTQAGCAMACSFCATGQAGFARHLTVGEVMEQVVHAARLAAPRRVSNVVFMGMGEPLANYVVTVESVRRLSKWRGISARNLTVSTVGVAPAIERLAKEGLAVTLAVSLHSANDDRRSAIVPINKRYPLERLSQAMARYTESTGRRVSIEWALIDGVNDLDRDVEELAQFARPLRAHVNLIPLNPTPGYLARGSTPERVREFRDELELRGVNVTVRNTRGRSIDAACGQLAAVTKPVRRVTATR